MRESSEWMKLISSSVNEANRQIQILTLPESKIAHVIDSALIYIKTREKRLAVNSGVR